MNREKLTEYTTTLRGMLPADGSTKGNSRLRTELREHFPDDEISDDDYWEIRQPLLTEGTIERSGGKGGSVRLTSIEFEEAANPNVALVEEPSKRELELYEPFAQSFTGNFAKEEGFEDHLTQITAQQGRRSTGGKWTRPDVAVIAVRSFEFVPGKHLEVISFEVKPSISTALEGVFEALAHSVFAHRSYLAVKIVETLTGEPNQDLERTSSECARHGVGLYTFTDETNFDTFNAMQDAVRRNPDPNKVNDFIATQISPGNKSLLKKWLR